MDENVCECEIYPEVLQLSFWFLVSLTSAMMNEMFVEKKFYDSLARVDVPLWIWRGIFLSWYVTLPFVVYYGVQRSECGMTWRIVVFFVFMAALSSVGYVFFRLKSLIGSIVCVAVIAALALAVTVIFSETVDWWSGIIMGVVLSLIMLLLLFVVHIGTNPANEYTIERLKNEKYSLENIDANFEI
jgi:hypothetical protein